VLQITCIYIVLLLPAPVTTQGLLEALPGSQAVQGQPGIHLGQTWVCLGNFDLVSVTCVTLSHKCFFVMNVERLVGPGTTERQ